MRNLSLLGTARLLFLCMLVSSCAPKGSQTGKWVVTNSPSGFREDGRGRKVLYKDIYGTKLGEDSLGYLLVAVALSLEFDDKDSCLFIGGASKGDLTELYLGDSCGVRDEIQILKFDRSSEEVIFDGAVIPFRAGMVVRGVVRRENGDIQITGEEFIQS